VGPLRVEVWALFHFPDEVQDLVLALAGLVRAREDELEVGEADLLQPRADVELQGLAQLRHERRARRDRVALELGARRLPVLLEIASSACVGLLRHEPGN